VIEFDEPSTLTAYTLVSGDYEVVAQTTDSVTLAEPASLIIDVRALISRR